MTDDAFDGFRYLHIDRPAAEREPMRDIKYARKIRPGPMPTTPKTRPELLADIVEAEAKGDFASAAEIRTRLERLDAEAVTVRVVDYERGPHHKRTRVYERGRLVYTELDD